MSVPSALSVVTALTSVAAMVAACNEDRFSVGDLASIEVEPGRVEFVIDTVATGSSATQQVYIRNVGSDPLIVRELRLEDATANAATPLEVPVSVEPPSAPPFEVAPDHLSPVPVTLLYRRLDDLPRSLRLVVRSSDPLRPEVTVAVEVVRATARLVATPSPVVFGASTPTPASKELRLINSGLVPLALHHARVDGEVAFAVELGGARIEGGAPGLDLDPPVVIPADSELTATVHFDPADPREHSGRLLLFGDGPNTADGFEVPIVGAYEGPCLVARPGRVDFGTKEPDTVSTIELEIENCGDGEVAIDPLRLSVAADLDDAELVARGVEATSSDRFELMFDSATPVVGAADGVGALTLAAGAKLTLPVRYIAGPSIPPAIEDAAPPLDLGFLVVKSDAPGATQAVRIEGRTAWGPALPPIDDTFPDIPGCEYEGDTGRLHDVVIKVAGDDYFHAWLDGERLPDREGDRWYYIGQYERQLRAGCYTLALEVWDAGGVLSGLIASVTIDGDVRWITQTSPEWMVSGPEAPPDDWFSLDFVPDPLVWKTPAECDPTAQQPWGTLPTAIKADGARWIWWSTNCRTLSRGYFRLTFTVD